jgi:hypothetical protein
MRKSFRPCWRSGLLVLAFAVFALPALSTLCWARALETIPYPITSVWPAAVRFMRVDRNFPVREKDEGAGYILFEYTDGPKPCKGSLELIRTTDPEGRDATRLAVSIPELPKRYEQALLDKLAVKLRDDQGPPPPPPAKPEPPKHDAAPPPEKAPQPTPPANPAP